MGFESDDGNKERMYSPIVFETGRVIREAGKRMRGCWRGRTGSGAVVLSDIGDNGESL